MEPACLQRPHGACGRLPWTTPGGAIPPSEPIVWQLTANICTKHEGRKDTEIHGILGTRRRSLPIPAYVLWAEECAQHLTTDDAVCANGTLTGLLPGLPYCKLTAMFKYLQSTSSKMTISMFNLDANVKCEAEITLNMCFYIIRKVVS